MLYVRLTEIYDRFYLLIMTAQGRFQLCKQVVASAVPINELLSYKVLVFVILRCWSFKHCKETYARFIKAFEF